MAENLYHPEEIDGTLAMKQRELREQTEIGKQRDPIKWVFSAVDDANVAEHLTEDELDNIGLKVIREFDIDDGSISDWRRRMDDAIRLAMLVKEEKHTPFQNASSVKYPLITTASIQFAARAYPELLKGGQAVKPRVIGEDPDDSKQERAERVAEHMNYQLSEEVPDWEEGTDRLLHILPVMGMLLRETYFDPQEGVNKSEILIPGVDVVIHYKTKSLRTAHRVTKMYTLWEHEIYERIKTGIFLDQPIQGSGADPEHGDEEPENIPHTFYAQHRRLDLDRDGYAEPYIVTVHRDTGKVVRIVANWELDGVQVQDAGNGSRKKEIVRIKPERHFTKYGFMPSMDGSFYDMGFGLLMGSINESINTTINQIHDAGTLHNKGGGFISSSARIPGGKYRFEWGEWKHVAVSGQSLAQSVYPFPRPEPSTVLFQMLGFLVEAGKDIGSVKDVLMGKSPGQNVPATTVLMLVEQGVKVFGAIHKRLYRSFGQEFRIHFRLNSKYLDPRVYFRVMDTPKAIAQADYDPKSVDVVPVADPTLSTDLQRLAKAEAALKMSGRPNVNEDELTRMYLEGLQLPPEVVDAIIPPEEMRGPEKPNPELLIETAKLELQRDELVLKLQELRLQEVKTIAEVEDKRASAIKKLAEAEAVEIGPQMQIYLAELQEVGKAASARMQAIGKLTEAFTAKQVSAGQQQGGPGQQGGPTE
jgi:chaperonin GroES